MKKNKTKSILLAFLVLIIAGATYMYFTPINRAPLDRIVQSNGEVTDDIVRILGWTGIRIVNDKMPADPDWPTWKVMIPSRKLEDVVKVTNGDLDQSLSWSQRKDKNPSERWEMKGSYSHNQVKYIVDLYFNNLKMGKVDAFPKQEYQGVLFLGATLSRVRMRLAHLNHLIETGKIKGPIYLLTGERTLAEAAEETEKDMLDNSILPIKAEWIRPASLPNDEGAMVKMVFDQSKHSGLNESDIIMVYTPKKEGEMRATTEGTVIKWLEQAQPKAGTYLAISNQPYNLYQQLVIQRVLLKQGRPDIKIEVTGASLDEEGEDEYRTPQKVAILLDNLNRIFYELKTMKDSTELQKLKK